MENFDPGQRHWNQLCVSQTERRWHRRHQAYEGSRIHTRPIYPSCTNEQNRCVDTTILMKTGIDASWQKSETLQGKGGEEEASFLVVFTPNRARMTTVCVCVMVQKSKVRGDRKKRLLKGTLFYCLDIVK